jgi:hypothetical protein
MPGGPDDADDPDDNPPDRGALLSALTTEHFTLQGARASTISEGTARAALYVGALSSTLVALGFIGQAASMGDEFGVFVLVALPTLYVLGAFTLVRLVEGSIEDLGYARAINRIRTYYLREVAGAEARYFSMSGHDDVYGVLANMGITRPSRWQLHFTLASMISVLNAVVGGVAVAFLAGVGGMPLAGSAVVGGATTTASTVLAARWQRRRHDEAREDGDVLFPSPTAPTA